MSSRSRSAFAHYAISLRQKHGRTQEELAELSKVNVAVIKRLEAGQGVRIEQLPALYGKQGLAITPDEWHTLIAYWLQTRLGPAIDPNALTPAIRQRATRFTSELATDEATLLKQFRALDDPTRTVVLRLLALLSQKRSKKSQTPQNPPQNLVNALQFFIDYASRK